MALPNVNIIRQNGAISQPPPNQDGYSGFVFYTNGTEGAGIGTLFTPLDSLNYTTSGSVLDYHISEYFRFSTSPLYLQIVKSAPTTFSEVENLKNFAGGTFRQVGVLNYYTNYTSSQITSLQTIANQLETEYAPAVILYTASAGTNALSSFTDLSTLSSNSVSYVIAEDVSAGSRSAYLRQSTGKFVSAIGTLLGVVSASDIEQDPGNVKLFNLTASEWSQPGFITGDKIGGASGVSITQQTQLDTFKYIFVRQYVGLSGSYFNYGWVCTNSSTDDFYSIENNRVYNEAFRNLRTAYLPEVNGNIIVNSDGTISAGAIQYYKRIGELALKPMQDAGEISSYNILIDSTQTPITTGTLNIVAQIVPTGIASQINVDLGFTL